MTKSGSLAVIDLGGQYCHLISRRLKDLGVPAVILKPTVSPTELERYDGVILSGGPSSVYDRGSPTVDRGLFELGVPIFGICYGHQLMARHFGGHVESGHGEYGISRLSVVKSNSIFHSLPKSQRVWMSHSDSVSSLPDGFVRLAATDHCEVAAYADLERKLYGVQFHPEVVHSEQGKDILRNFAVRVCGVRPSRLSEDRVERLVSEIRAKVADASVFFLVSGGVDSTVAFALCARALPRERILGLYVDTGLMRKGEKEELEENLRGLGLSDRLTIRDESSLFATRLADVVEPEEKRKVIGGLFVDIQARAMREFGIDADHWLLGQGTIYPDTIESGGQNGLAAVIKTHHNRCAEIRTLLEEGRVLEPLAEFYKDEVRELGAHLRLGRRLTQRWPFPGPGLAIRCLCAPGGGGAVSTIDINSHFSSYEGFELPLRSVGVQGDGRTYRNVVAVRGPFDYPSLQDLSSALCNESRDYNRVIFLLSDRVRLELGTVVQRPLNAQRIGLLREADFIARSILEEEGLTEGVWQFPVVLIPLAFRGGESVVLRPVRSEDGMTADFAQLPRHVLVRIADTIQGLDGVDAVFLDTTNKPPATIEWE